MMTTHRQENIGEPMRNMIKAIKRNIDENPDIRVIHSIHLNPVAREVDNDILRNTDRIKFIVILEV